MARPCSPAWKNEPSVGLGAVVAEGSASIGIALRRWCPPQRWRFRAADAAMTRWHISTLPSDALSASSVGRHRWLVELICIATAILALSTLTLCKFLRCEKIG